MRDMKKLFNLNEREASLFRRLNSPRKIQDYINAIPNNFETDGETYSSPRVTLQRNSAHCFEGALLAAAIFWFHNEKPIILDLRTIAPDIDHVVTLFKRHERWGAISKTNHAVLRYREPIYKTVRELVMSYFNEYYLDDGVKTLRSYSRPFDLSGNTDWITTEKNLENLVDRLNSSRHYEIMTKPMIASLRLADPVELIADDVLEWEDPSSSRP